MPAVFNRATGFPGPAFEWPDTAAQPSSSSASLVMPAMDIP